MAKRGQTGGMPKGSPAKPTSADAASHKRNQPRLLREYKTKAEREAVIQRWIIIGTALLVGISLVILLAAVLVDQLVVPGQAAAVVNGDTITIGEFQSRVRFERALINNQLNQAVVTAQSLGMSTDELTNFLGSQPPYSTWLNEIQVPDQLGNRILNEIIEDRLIRQQAAALGVTVTDAEVQTKINEFFDYDPNAALTTPTPTVAPSETPTPFVSPTPSNTPTATATPELTATATFTPFPSATPTTTPDATQRAESFTSLRDEFYGYLRSQAGLSDDDIYAFFESLTLRDALRDHITADQTRTASFVNVRQIVVESQDRAQEVITALEQGESFAQLAQTVSIDASSTQGGELGWQQLSNFDTLPGEAFTDAITNAEVGAVVGPIQSTAGFHVAQLRAREDRDLTEEEYEAARDAAFERYLEDLHASNQANIQTFDAWLDNVPENPRFVLSIS